MIDIGANLSSSQFSHDTAQVLARAKEQGVECVILTSTDTQSYTKNQKIIQQSLSQDISYPELYTTLGLHPHYAKEGAAFFAAHKSIVPNEHNRLKALGEFGLDYFRMLTPKAVQLGVLDQFLELAQTPAWQHLPLFLHEREAHADFLAALHNAQAPNAHIVHCFTGNKTQLKNYLDAGCYIGLTGWISDKKRGGPLREAAAFIPLDRLLIETDAPYLTPQNMGKQVRRNEPAFLKFVAQEIAVLQGISVESVAAKTTENAQRIFQLPQPRYHSTPKLKN